MARRPKTKNSRKFAALQLAALGAVLVLVPWILRQSPMADGFRPLAPLGWLLLLVGGGLFRILQKLEGKASLQRSSRKGPSRNDVQLDARRVKPDSAAARRSAASQVPTEPLAAVAGPHRPTRWSADVFRSIEWRRFEAVIEALFAQSGFVTSSQSHGADGGVDVWLHLNDASSPAVGIVQCKHFSAKPVGVDKVRELRGVMASHQLTRGHFATSSKFSADAIAFASRNGIHLLDADGLLRLIEKRTLEQQEALLAVALAGDYSIPTCVNCGTKMVARTPKGGGARFWGCRNFPACRTTMAMRAL